MPTRIGLVGCVSEKLDKPTASAELYISALFVGRKRYVLDSCDSWLILSAKFGVIRPEKTIAPYDETLKGESVAHKRAWAKGVLEQVVEAFGSNLNGFEFEMHAGADYRDFGLADGLRSLGATVANPVQGLGIGQQLQFYKSADEHRGGRRT